MLIFKQNYLFGFVLLVIFFGCKTEQNKKNKELERKIELNSKHKDFENLISIASCSGPDITYSTEVHSTKNGYTYFKQQYGSGKEDYEATIFDKTKGFTIDKNGNAIDTLSKESIEIIRGHEFHKIHITPNTFFNAIKFEEETQYQEKPCEKYTGTDVLNNPITLYYSRKEKLILGVKLSNPNDTTEQIEIKYKEWMESDIGKIAKKVEIIQGGKDIYQFHYKSIIINDKEFREFSLKNHKAFISVD
ncbi:hypothetical protein KIM67_08105 [Flagellimonas sp. 389]|uniref:hypothetical protein n=1 Tax=Flagellimonas sp. 389 TaxID=2835862 RepID=UPI001BD26F58|nr:hypothetical protein [Flagellimonas sp. 389]MBS9462370.1 hypothetical protein [Flagellimonas sp. 389]